jgi:hypothetical protein
MTATDITSLRALYEAATGGEWRAVPDDVGPVRISSTAAQSGFASGPFTVVGSSEWTYCTDEDAAFIAAAHTAFPALLAAAEKLARYEAAMGSDEARDAVGYAIMDETERWSMVAGDTGEDDRIMRTDDSGKEVVVTRVPNGDGAMHLWGSLSPDAVATAALAALARIVEAGE